MKRREIFTFGFQAVLGLSISMLSLLPRNSEAGEYFGHSATKESRTSRQKPHQYFVPSTNPRVPTWRMQQVPRNVVPGDWTSYAPLGFGGYRFPAVGASAYR